MDHIASLIEIMSLWNTVAYFNSRRKCLFESIMELSYHHHCNIYDMAKIMQAIKIAVVINKNAEMRHFCARLTYFTIIRGFLSYVDDRDLMRLQNYFVTWKKLQESWTSDGMSINDLTQKFHSINLVGGRPTMSDLAKGLIRYIIECLIKLLQEE